MIDYRYLTNSYFFEDERGLFPEVEFVYDLKLPQNFQPINSDGEVDEFYCWSIDKVCCLRTYFYDKKNQICPTLVGEV